MNRILRLLCYLSPCLGAAVVWAQDVYQPWTASQDPAAQYWKKVAAGEAALDTSSEKAYLASLLTALNIPVESQVLVFSKTSLQNAAISPSRPRAIYFNDECYIGWVQGGMMEIIAMDPEQGAQFYVLDYPTASRATPTILPSEQCISCHEGNRTNRVKGMLVRSVYADDRGQPLLRYGSFLSTSESPLSERWGGWYVTGKHGDDLHMGNIFIKDEGDQPTLPRERGANLLSLESLFPTEPYPAKTSDIVALMVLEHQCSMQNTLSAAATAVREAILRQRALQDAFGEPASDMPQGSALSVLQNQAEKVLEKLLFRGEYELKDGGVEGTVAFQDAFRKGRKESAEGRSLRDFQLRTRLFKYRCSYMIYSRTFAALPQVLKDRIYTRLNEILQPGADTTNQDYAYLADSEKTHLRQILSETLPDLRAAWNTAK